MTTHPPTHLVVGDLIVYCAGKKKDFVLDFGRVVSLDGDGGMMEIPSGGGTAGRWFNVNQVVRLPAEFIDRYFTGVIPPAPDPIQAAEDHDDAAEAAKGPILGEARTKVDLLEVARLLVSAALLADLSGAPGRSLHEGRVGMAAVFMGLDPTVVSQGARKCASMAHGVQGDLFSESVELASKLLALRLMTLQQGTDRRPMDP